MQELYCDPLILWFACPYVVNQSPEDFQALAKMPNNQGVHCFTKRHSLKAPEAFWEPSANQIAYYFFSLFIGCIFQ
ncbi:hypothetical protein BH09BAC3_BH09BAC3_30750 [soil metagenome]